MKKQRNINTALSFTESTAVVVLVVCTILEQTIKYTPQHQVQADTTPLKGGEFFSVFFEGEGAVLLHR